MQGVLLSENEAAYLVASVGDALDGLVGDTEVLLQDGADVLRGNLDAELRMDCLSDFC